MEARHKIIKSKNLIVVDAEGRVDFEASKEAIRKLSSDPEYSHEYMIIMDLREVSCDLSVTDVVELAAFMAWPDPALPTRRKVAVLVAPDGAYQLASFMETCAQNRGLRLKAFTSVRQAETWLDSELDDSPVTGS